MEQLNLLIQLAHGFAEHFGSSCEVVIHDLKNNDIEHSIVYIENGHVTNRKKGDGPSRIVLKTLKENPDKIEDAVAYLTKSNDGRILKSSTFYIRDEKNEIRYIFSINYDISGLLNIESALHSLIRTNEEKKLKEKAENVQNEENKVEPLSISHNVNELLDQMINQALELIGKPVAVMNKEDKIRVVQNLNDAGAFLITKSGDKVASVLDISKFTLYNYIHNKQ